MNIFMIGFGLSYGAIIWCYYTDILPCFGFPFVISINYCFSLIVSFIGSFIFNLGIDLPFLIFLCCSILSIIFVYFVLIETKGKS